MTGFWKQCGGLQLAEVQRGPSLYMASCTPQVKVSGCLHQSRVWLHHISSLHTSLTVDSSFFIFQDKWRDLYLLQLGDLRLSKDHLEHLGICCHDYCFKVRKRCELLPRTSSRAGDSFWVQRVWRRLDFSMLMLHLRALQMWELSELSSLGS